jgi:glycosyltransferase involved in cell wall biosynthesis
MRELFVVTNLPSPYRLHELRVIGRHLAERGIRLEVRFMADTERGRYWPDRGTDAGFSNQRSRGLTVYPAGDRLPVHLNPGLLLEAVRRPARWVVLGGAWYQPAVLGALAAPRSPRRYLLVHCENAEASPHRRGGAVLDRARREVFRRSDGFVVASEQARRFTRLYSPRPAVQLPHFADESLYRDRVQALRRGSPRDRFGFASDATVFAWPARLHPSKGILPFLDSIRDVAGNHVIAIAGEGPQRREIEAFVARWRLRNVRLLGHLGLEDLLALYASADALLLPSIFDPCPLVNVEAMWAALPIFISRHAGAASETVVDQLNGWIVDPGAPGRMREAFRRVLDTQRCDLAEMGQRSLERAYEEFESDRAARRFVDGLLREFPP